MGGFWACQSASMRKHLCFVEVFPLGAASRLALKRSWLA